MARWHSKPKSGEDTEMDPNKAWRRTGPRRRPRRKEAPATAEEAALCYARDIAANGPPRQRADTKGA